MRFKDEVAVVFAASCGIGRAVAERLGREGAAAEVNYFELPYCPKPRR